MPVLGHAFIGLATAECTRPVQPYPAARALWAPVLVTLAYLPDIAHQAVRVVGFPEFMIATHSAPVLFLISGALAYPLAGIMRVSLRRAFLITLCCTAVHLALDALQATDRSLLWPFSSMDFGLGLRLIPTNSVKELLCFGIPCGLILVVVRIFRRRFQARAISVDGRDPAYTMLLWSGRVASSAILIAAGWTHYLRDSRDRELAAGKSLVQAGLYEESLPVLARADVWPGTSMPGRIPFWVGVAHLRLGHRDRAEQELLTALKEDPDFYWTPAELAEFYATSDASAEVRRRRIEPYLRIILSQCAEHPRYPRLLDRLERQLGLSLEAYARPGDMPPDS